MHDFALGHHPGGDPLHDLWDEALGHLVHRLQRGDGRCASHGRGALQAAGPVGRVCTTNWPTSVQQARQHLALFLCALGKQVVFFDRPEDRLDLLEGRIGPQHAARF